MTFTEIRKTEMKTMVYKCEQCHVEIGPGCESKKYFVLTYPNVVNPDSNIGEFQHSFCMKCASKVSILSLYSGKLSSGKFLEIG